MSKNIMEVLLNKVANYDNALVLPKLHTESVDLILTDPPYGMNFQSNSRTVSAKFKKIKGDADTSRFEIYPEFRRVLKMDKVGIFFCAWKNFDDEAYILKEVFGANCIKNVIVWHKGGGGLGDLEGTLSTDYELAIIVHKGKGRFYGKREGSVWYTPKVPPEQMIHPTEKPLVLIQKLIKKFSVKGDLILDPYAGSCVTGWGALIMNRNFICIEFEKEYATAGWNRIKKEKEKLSLSLFGSEYSEEADN
jgi:site-specific DNA-methyltransferase (adenine-specific)